MTLTPGTAIELALLACALAAALVVQPWRLLASRPGDSGLATPLLAALTLLPWLWAWPASGALPIPLHWSAAPLAVLMLGWPLAVPVLALAGLSTLFTADASWNQALATTVWSGLVPATLVLLLGHAVRTAFGTHPAVYLMLRAFAVPLLALFAGSLVAAAAGQDMLASAGGDMRVVAAFLLAMGEATWTCGIATILVACRPQWLATWSDALYLGLPSAAPAAVPARARPKRQRDPAR